MIVAQKCSTDVLHLQAPDDPKRTVCGLPVIRGEWGVYELTKKQPMCSSCESHAGGVASQQSLFGGKP